MADRVQTYKNHARLLPVYHFFVIPVLLLNVVNEVRRAYYYPSGGRVVAVIVAIAIPSCSLASRRASERLNVWSGWADTNTTARSESRMNSKKWAASMRVGLVTAATRAQATSARPESSVDRRIRWMRWRNAGAVARGTAVIGAPGGGAPAPSRLLNAHTPPRATSNTTTKPAITAGASQRIGRIRLRLHRHNEKRRHY